MVCFGFPNEATLFGVVAVSPVDNKRAVNVVPAGIIFMFSIPDRQERLQIPVDRGITRGWGNFCFNQLN